MFISKQTTINFLFISYMTSAEFLIYSININFTTKFSSRPRRKKYFLSHGTFYIGHRIFDKCHLSLYKIKFRPSSNMILTNSLSSFSFPNCLSIIIELQLTSYRVYVCACMFSWIYSLHNIYDQMYSYNISR